MLWRATKAVEGNTYAGREKLPKKTLKWNNRKVFRYHQVSDLNNSPSATSPPTSHPILPKKMSPRSPIKFSVPERARKGSHCTVRAQVSKCSLKALKAFTSRATKDTSKTGVSPYRTSDIVVTVSGHSALGWHSRRWLTFKKSIHCF